MNFFENKFAQISLSLVHSTFGARSSSPAEDYERHQYHGKDDRNELCFSSNEPEEYGEFWPKSLTLETVPECFIEAFKEIARLAQNALISGRNWVTNGWRDAHPSQACDGLRNCLGTSLYAALDFQLVKLLHLSTEGLGLHLGNADAAYSKDFERQTPEQLLVEAAILAPIFEEAIFRGYSIYGAKRLGVWTDRSAWIVGTTVALAFAYMHNFVVDRNSAPWEFWKVQFHGEYIPLPQFIGGLIFWNIRLRSSLPYAMLAHAMTNAAVLSEIWRAP